MDLDHCRIYVCKSHFGQRDECLKFKNIVEYKNWVRLNPDRVGETSFQPICDTKEVFDRLILSMRSGKIGIVKVHI